MAWWRCYYFNICLSAHVNFGFIFHGWFCHLFKRLPWKCDIICKVSRIPHQNPVTLQFLQAPQISRNIYFDRKIIMYLEPNKDTLLICCALFDREYKNRGLIGCVWFVWFFLVWNAVTNQFTNFETPLPGSHAFVKCRLRNN